MKRLRVLPPPHLQLLRGHVQQVCGPLCVVLLSGAALLLIDDVALALREAEEAADHRQVFPERAILWGRVLLPAQQLTQPAL